MRISDWSSDVCSSDLARVDQRVGDPLHAVNIDTIADIAAAAAIAQLRHQIDTLARIAGGVRVGDVVAGRVECGLVGQQRRTACRKNVGHYPAPLIPSSDGRSEEHTSELQSLMRTSDAVFCLKKKK